MEERSEILCQKRSGDSFRGGTTEETPLKSDYMASVATNCTANSKGLKYCVRMRLNNAVNASFTATGNE